MEKNRTENRISKKSFLFFLFILSFTIAFSQEIDSTSLHLNSSASSDTILDINPPLPPIKQSRFSFLKNIKPVIELDANNSFVTNRPVFINGAKLGMNINKNKFGVGLYQMTPYNLNPNKLLSGGDYYNVPLHMNYSMLFYERVLFQNYKWEFSLPVFYGFGTAVAYLENTRTGKSSKFAESDIYVLSANFSAHYKLKHWVGIGTGFGYRQNFSPQDPPLEKQLSDIYYIVKVKLFLGEIYKGFAKKEKVRQDKADYIRVRAEEKENRKLNLEKGKAIKYGIGSTVMFPSNIVYYGGYAQAEKRLFEDITATTSLGVLYGKHKDAITPTGNVMNSSTVQVQVLAGSRYYIFNTQKGIYLQVNLGYINSRTTEKIATSVNSFLITNNTISFGGGMGYQFNKFDFNVRFLSKTGDGLILRAAYLF